MGSQEEEALRLALLQQAIEEQQAEEAQAQDAQPPVTPQDIAAGQQLRDITRDPTEALDAQRASGVDPDPYVAMRQANPEGPDAAAQSATMPSMIHNTVSAFGGGAVEAGFQTYDFFAGPTPGDQKSDFRQWAEKKYRGHMDALGPAGGFVGGLGQFAGGMVGLGKFTEGLKVLPWIGRGIEALEGLAQGSKAVKAGVEATKATIVNTTMFDPHQERLSNVIEQFPQLRNPITGFLAAHPGDTDAEGRLKNALENLGIEATAGALLMGGMRLYKALSSGDREGITRASDEVLKTQSTIEAEAAAPQLGRDEHYLVRNGEVVGGDGSPQDGSSPSAPTTGLEGEVLPQDRSPAPGVPEDRRDLLDLGYTEQQLNRMTPEQVRDSRAAYSIMKKDAEHQASATKYWDGVGDAADRKDYLTEIARDIESGRVILPENPKDLALKDSSSVYGEGQLAAAAQDLRDWAKSEGLGEGPEATKEIIANLEAEIFDGVTRSDDGVYYKDIIKYLQRQDAGDLTGAPGSPVSGTFELGVADREAAGLPPAKGPGDVVYSIIRDGQPVGYVHATIRGNTARIEDIWSTTGQTRGALGPGVASQLLKQFQRAHPEVINLTGRRTTGARNGGREHGYADEGGVEVSVDIPKARTMAARSYLDASSGDRVSSGEGGTSNTQAPEGFDPALTGSIMKAIREDWDATDGAGKDWLEAVQSGERMASPPNSLPYHKMATPEEVESFINHAVEAVNKEGILDNLKGGAVLTDAKARERISQYAAIFNTDPNAMMSELAKAGEAAHDMFAHMEMGYLIANKMFKDAYVNSLAIQQGRLGQWGGNAVAATEEVQAQLARALQALGHANSIRAAGGRVVRRNRAEFAPDQATIDSLKTVNPDMLVQLMVDSAGDVRNLRKITQPSFLRRIQDFASYYYASNLLWGWKTQVNNIVSNTVTALVRPAERVIGSYTMGEAGASIRQQAVKQYLYMASSLPDAWNAAVEAFRLGDSRLAMHNLDLYGTPTQGNRALYRWKPWDSMANVTYNTMASFGNMGQMAVGGSLRFLAAADEAAKVITYRSIVGAKAHLEAVDLGLSGKELSEHVNSRLTAAFDDAGRATDMDAKREAQIATLSQDLDTGLIAAGARSFQSFAAQFPPARLFVPFVKTPANLVRYGINLTPGLNVLSKDFRDAFHGQKGDTPQQRRLFKAQARGQASLGLTFSLLTGVMAYNGMITGPGPGDSETRRNLMATGWKPFAYRRVNDDGSVTYTPLKDMLGPFAIPFTIAAAVGEASQHAGVDQSTVERTASALMLALTKGLADQTYLRNLHQAMDMLMSGEGRQVERQVGNIASNFVPASSLLRNANAAFVDDEMRDAVSIMDQMIATIPGLSSTVPPRRDIWGDPIHAKLGLSSTADGVVDLEMERLAMDTPDGRSIAHVTPTGTGYDLRDVTTEDGRNAYDRLQELSGHLPGAPSLKSQVAKVMQSEAYLKAPDGSSSVKGTKLYMLGSVINPYHEKAKKLLMKDRNVRKAMYTANEQVRAAYAAKQRDPNGALPQRDVLNDILGKFGMGGGEVSVPERSS
ncbi:hypothetical protein C5L14_14615 [Labrys okinawensis]|uniref:Uncharacterized protein n=1 Tax=Labrys okinawensis TaxID=346911 RepID=A0A2S9QB56_9HYPH|nr:hypothetical protein [Labrys okinawensis]PRH86564.1 hypothetical protein C5L14_14615 [Labrys okinawensis]